jgi:hypothetical protein
LAGNRLWRLSAIGSARFSGRDNCAGWPLVFATRVSFAEDGQSKNQRTGDACCQQKAATAELAASFVEPLESLSHSHVLHNPNQAKSTLSLD